MEINVLKYIEDIRFPYENFSLPSTGSLANSKNKLNIVKYNDYLGLIYTDSKGKHRDIGVLAKVTGIINGITLLNSNYITSSYIKLETLCRFKIIEAEASVSDLFKAKVELLEDEISNILYLLFSHCGHQKQNQKRESF